MLLIAATDLLALATDSNQYLQLGICVCSAFVVVAAGATPSLVLSNEFCICSQDLIRDGSTCSIPFFV